jgi:ADP-ribosylglycohydrolase
MNDPHDPDHYPEHTLDETITGCILGTAIGDALGLPYEGLTPQRQRRLFARPDRYHLVLGKGMVSDDTEHTCMVAQALIVSASDPTRFVRSLARQLRLWLLCVPAGIGLATLRATLRLWLGFGPQRSGVFSAGNGPAMRSALIGVCWGHDTVRLRELVRLSTRITHTDPKAEYGALAIALAAHASRTRSDCELVAFIERVRAVCGDEGEELIHLIQRAVESARAGESSAAFAASLGLANGVSGYIYHTVPVVLHAWFRHPRDLQGALNEIIACGGDTDTTAAILGGIVGAGIGRSGLPQEWIDGLWEWPRSTEWMAQVGKRLSEVVAQRTPQRAVPSLGMGIPLRNLLFASVILAHGFRRLLPPY